MKLIDTISNTLTELMNEKRYFFIYRCGTVGCAVPHRSPLFPTEEAAMESLKNPDNEVDRLRYLELRESTITDRTVCVFKDEGGIGLADSPKDAAFKRDFPAAAASSVMEEINALKTGTRKR
jgi:hypothetical protein